MEATFTFRAQPALDVRQREFDARRRDLATAEWELRAARQLFTEAEQTLRDAHAQAGETLRHAGVEQYVWHRVWIDRVERAKAAHAVSVAQRQDEVAKAAAACRKAKQRVDAMEKLKEKARTAFEHEARLREQRELDALATMRFVADARARDRRRAS
jgi:flagellar export protein FliJ